MLSDQHLELTSRNVAEAYARLTMKSCQHLFKQKDVVYIRYDFDIAGWTQRTVSAQLPSCFRGFEANTQGGFPVIADLYHVQEATIPESAIASLPYI